MPFNTNSIRCPECHTITDIRSTRPLGYLVECGCGAVAVVESKSPFMVTFGKVRDTVMGIFFEVTIETAQELRVCGGCGETVSIGDEVFIDYQGTPESENLKDVFGDEDIRIESYCEDCGAKQAMVNGMGSD